MARRRGGRLLDDDQFIERLITGDFHDYGPSRLLTGGPELESGELASEAWDRLRLRTWERWLKRIRTTPMDAILPYGARHFDGISSFDLKSKRWVTLQEHRPRDSKVIAEILAEAASAVRSRTNDRSKGHD